MNRPKHTIVWLAVTAVLGLGRAAAASSLTILWDPNPEQDIAGYVVSYGTEPGVHTSRVDAGNSTSMLLENLADGLTYYLVVQAYNTDGLMGDPSQEVVGPDVSAPIEAQSCLATQPTGLVTSTDGGSVEFSWQEPTGLCRARSYTIEIGSAPGWSNLGRFSTRGAESRLSVAGVSAGTYFARARSKNAAGTSAPSAEVLVVVGRASCAAQPGVPTNLTLVSQNGGAATLAWGAASGSPTSYVVDAGRAAGQIGLVPGLSTVVMGNLGSPPASFTATGLASGTYYVRVRARNACGVGPSSNEIAVTVR